MLQQSVAIVVRIEMICGNDLLEGYGLVGVVVVYVFPLSHTHTYTHTHTHTHKIFQVLKHSLSVGEKENEDGEKDTKTQDDEDEVQYLSQHEDSFCSKVPDVLVHLSPIVDVLSVLRAEYTRRESKEDENTRLNHLEMCLRKAYRMYFNSSAMSVVMSRCSNVTISITFQQSSILEELKECSEYRLVLDVLRRVWQDYEGQLVKRMTSKLDELLAHELDRRDHRIFVWNSTLMISLNSSKEFKSSSLEWRDRLLRFIENVSPHTVVFLSSDASFDHYVREENGKFDVKGKSLLFSFSLDLSLRHTRTHTHTHRHCISHLKTPSCRRR